MIHGVAGEGDASMCLHRLQNLLWAISKMNITLGYEPWSGSLILSSPSKTRQSNVWLLWHAGSEVSSLLKCGTTLTEVALAIREFFLVGKRVEVVRDVVVDYSSSPMIDAI